MAETPDPDSFSSPEPPFLDLFMTVVRVADWSRIVRWYIDTLRLVPVLTDPKHEFALLVAGQGRLGLHGVRGTRESIKPSKVRLVFQVRDVDFERERLTELGVEVSAVDNRDEGYREIRLHDPDGNSLTLFAWTDPARSLSPRPIGVEDERQDGWEQLGFYWVVGSRIDSSAASS